MSDVVEENMDLSWPTPGERIWLWRRRLPRQNVCGPSQQRRGGIYGRGGNRMTLGEAALYLGVAYSVYEEAEKGGNPDVLAAIRERGGDLRMPDCGEQCALARRRSGGSVADLCAEMGGISKPTFYEAERRGTPELVRLWERHGYTF